MAKHQNLGRWHRTLLVDRDGDKISTLEDVDVETDRRMFGTVKEAHFGRHVRFDALGWSTIGPPRSQSESLTSGSRAPRGTGAA